MRGKFSWVDSTITDFVVKKKIARIAKKVLNACVTVCAVKAKIVDPSVLSEYVRRVMKERELDAPAVEARATKSGLQIDRSYINKILTPGWTGHLTVPKLQALAAGLGVSEDEVFALVRGVQEPEGFPRSKAWELFNTIQQIENKEDKRLAEGMLDAVIRTSKDLLAKQLQKPADGPKRIETIRKTK